MVYLELMAKHPLDLGDRKLSKEELTDALRLSIIAELDAINLYLQLARATDDENARKVFQDIAREEKTHVGEFLALLKSIDAEQVEELKSGAEEVEELTGIRTGNSDPDPEAKEQAPEIFSADEWRSFLEAFRKSADNTRILRRYLPIFKVGRGVDAVVVERVRAKGGEITLESRNIIPLEELSIEFKVDQRSIDYSKRYGDPSSFPTALHAAAKLGFMEDEYLLKQILGCREATPMSISSWDQGGAAVSEVSKAVGTLAGKGAPRPYVLLVGPERYSKLVSVHERTGIMELTRLEKLVDKVVMMPQLPGDKAIMISSSPAALDIALGADTIVDYIGPEQNQHTFRAWETIALRIKNPEAVIIMAQE